MHPSNFIYRKMWVIHFIIDDDVSGKTSRRTGFKLHASFKHPA
jgi:hypothetical protein